MAKGDKVQYTKYGGFSHNQGTSFTGIVVELIDYEGMDFSSIVVIKPSNTNWVSEFDVIPEIDVNYAKWTVRMEKAEVDEVEVAAADIADALHVAEEQYPGWTSLTAFGIEDNG